MIRETVKGMFVDVKPVTVLKVPLSLVIKKVNGIQSLITIKKFLHAKKRKSF